MNNFEREYINYRPQLGFTPKILSKVSPTTAYQLPPAIDKLTEVLPSSILDEVGKLIDDISILQKRLENCMKDTIVEGISFEEYKKEKRGANPDFDVIDKFEIHQKEKIHGTTQGEVYPMLIELEDELTEYRDFLNKQFYNGNANYEHLETVREKEKNKIEKSIEKDTLGQLNEYEYKKMEVDVQLSRYALNRIENNKKFVKGLNKVLCSSVQTYYNGHIRDIVREFSNAPINVLEQLNGMNKISFKGAVIKSRQDSRRDSKLNTKEIKKSINTTMNQIAMIKTENSNNVLSWIDSMDTDFDQSPTTMIIEDALDKIEFVEKEYDKSIKELYKHNELDRVLKEDQLSTLLEKKQSRQIFNLISDIVKEKKNNTFEIDKFISDRKLEHPGTLCTR